MKYREYCFLALNCAFVPLMCVTLFAILIYSELRYDAITCDSDDGIRAEMLDNLCKNGAMVPWDLYGQQLIDVINLQKSISNKKLETVEFWYVSVLPWTILMACFLKMFPKYLLGILDGNRIRNMIVEITAEGSFDNGQDSSRITSLARHFIESRRQNNRSIRRYQFIEGVCTIIDLICFYVLFVAISEKFTYLGFDLISKGLPGIQEVFPPLAKCIWGGPRFHVASCTLNVHNAYGIPMAVLWFTFVASFVLGACNIVMNIIAATVSTITKFQLEKRWQLSFVEMVTHLNYYSKTLEYCSSGDIFTLAIISRHVNVLRFNKYIMAVIDQLEEASSRNEICKEILALE